jgi:hypothetical protein
MLKKHYHFTATVLWWIHFWAWPLTTKISRPYPARLHKVFQERNPRKRWKCAILGPAEG